MRTTSRRLLGAALTVTAVGAVGVLPAGAEDGRAGSHGSVSIADATASDGRCTDVPVSWDLTMDPDWAWTLILTDAEGTLSLVQMGDGALGAGTGAVTVCPERHGVGRFELAGTLSMYHDEYVPTAVEPVSVGFEFRRQRTAATIRASDAEAPPGSGVRLSGCVASGGARDAGRPAALQIRRPGGEWHTLERTATTRRGCWAESVTARAGTHDYRLRVSRTDVEAAAASDPVTVVGTR